MDEQAIAQNIRREERKRQQLLEKRIEAAWREVEILKTRFLEIDPALRKILLFGSLGKKQVRSTNFDIDLAVKCSPDKYLQLVGVALDSDFKVDVVDLTTVNQNFRQFILQDSAVIYEQR